MYRSFTDRVLGGVCGGLGAAWRVNPWLVRIVVILFSTVSLGAGVLLYLALWWAMPLESLLEDHRTNPLNVLLILAIVAIIVGAWIGQVTGQLSSPSGQQIFLPVALLALSGIFLLRQLGRRV